MAAIRVMSMKTRRCLRCAQRLEAVSNPEVEGLLTASVIVVCLEDNLIDRPVVHADSHHIGRAAGVVLIFSIAGKYTQIVADLVGGLNEVTPLLVSTSGRGSSAADIPAGYKSLDLDSANGCIQSCADKSSVSPLISWLLYTSPSPRDSTRSSMPSSA